MYHVRNYIWRAFTLPRTEFQRMNVHNSVPCKELHLELNVHNSVPCKELHLESLYVTPHRIPVHERTELCTM
jgi:hypothetical protein